MKIYQTDNDYAKYETLFYLGNGNIGIRNSLEEKAFNRATYKNGFYDTFKMQYEEIFPSFSEQGEKMIQVFDAQKIEIYLDNELIKFDNDFDFEERYIDLSKGIYVRKFIYNFNGNIINFKVKKMVSFVNTAIAISQYKITCETGKIKVINYISNHYSKQSTAFDVRVDHDVQHVEIIKNEKGYILGETKNLGNKISLSYLYSVPYKNIPNSTGCENVLPGEFDLILSYDSKLKDFDIKKMKQEQKNFLDDFWKYSKIIMQDKELEKKINYSIFALLQSTPIDSNGKVSIAAKGLSGDGYCGHYFWDAEMYYFPMYLWTNPKIAKNILEYRYNILKNAKENARNSGISRGALYPWRTIAGRESSGYFPSGAAQYHISLDIAYAVINYFRVTNDLEFIKSKGFEIIHETAKLFAEIGYFRDNMFHIDAVTGPDEYSCIVDDNYYTNMMCKYNFEWLVKISKTIKIQVEDEEFYVEAANKMATKVTNNIIWQDRDFLNKKVWDFEKNKSYPLLMNYSPLMLYRHQVCKQADAVLATMLLEEYTNFEDIKNTVYYYDGVTTHDSSLSFSIFSIMFSRIKDNEKAQDYFLKNATLDFDDVHENTKDGIHAASMAGTWMTLLYGFIGLRLKGENLIFHPYLPSNISPFEMVIKYLEMDIIISINHEHIKLRLVDEGNIQVFVSNKPVVLSNIEQKVITYER